MSKAAQTALPPTDVDKPIINSPFEEPAQYWVIEKAKPPVKEAGPSPSQLLLPGTGKLGSWSSVYRPVEPGR